MKNLIALLALTLLSIPSFAIERDVEIECNLSTAQSTTVSTVRLFSATDEIVLEYRNGSSETVKPVAAKNSGLFGDENFSADLVWNNGQVFSPDTAVGPIFIRYACFLTPTIQFDRCISQGDHEPAPFAGVRMRLEGKALTFFGKNICTRVDRSPL